MPKPPQKFSNTHFYTPKHACALQTVTQQLVCASSIVEKCGLLYTNVLIVAVRARFLLDTVAASIESHMGIDTVFKLCQLSMRC